MLISTLNFNNVKANYEENQAACKNLLTKRVGAFILIPSFVQVKQCKYQRINEQRKWEVLWEIILLNGL